MLKINDSNLIHSLITKHQINQYFSSDMTNFVNLYFWKKGDFICHEGDTVNHLFFFAKGRAKIYITLKNGKSLLLCFYEPLKIIGDIEIMTNHTATASVQVIEDTYCLGIRKDVVEKKLLDDPHFLKFLAKSLSLELERSSKNSSINLLYPVENRLASYILATSVNQNGTLLFRENLTQLAELLGTSYRHLMRSINLLCQKEIIKRNQKTLEIVKLGELKILAADLYR